MGVKVLKRRYPSGSVKLFLDISFNGRRRKEALGFSLGGDRLENRETMKFVEELRAKRELELLEQSHGVLQSSKRKRSFVEYYNRLIETKNSHNTRESWKFALGHLEAFVGRDPTFSELTREYLEKFKSYLLGLDKVSPNSAQIYFSRIKTALNQAVKDGIISSNPGAFVTIRKQHSLPSYLVFEEIQKLANTLITNLTVKNAFLFSCFSGLRYSDIRNLTWDNVKVDHLLFKQQKTSTSERLPLSLQAQEILQAQRSTTPSSKITLRHAEGSVFLLPRQSVIDKALKKWAKDAKIEKRISFHVARHTFATLALSSGIDIYTTSKLLGHKSLQSTQVYAKVIDESKKKAVDRLPMLK